MPVRAALSPNGLAGHDRVINGHSLTSVRLPIGSDAAVLTPMTVPPRPEATHSTWQQEGI
jgi:hypothetical protein